MVGAEEAVGRTLRWHSTAPGHKGALIRQSARGGRAPAPGIEESVQQIGRVAARRTRALDKMARPFFDRPGPARPSFGTALRLPVGKVTRTHLPIVTTSPISG
jgi:hypothetical protein